MKRSLATRFPHRSAVAAAILLTGLATLVLPASAARFGVRVVTPEGDPVQGAAVCIGMPGNPRQFGSAFTDRFGNAALEVPAVPLVVTVSRDRFAGVRLSAPATRIDFIREVTLRDDVPGPRCRGGSTVAEVPSATDMPDLDILGIEVQRDGPELVLVPRVVSGSPTHFRIGRGPELDYVGWQDFRERIVLGDIDTSEGVALFLQLRERIGDDDAWIETVSPVVPLRVTRG